MPNNRIVTLLGLAALGTLAYARWIEPERLETRGVPIRLKRLARAFHGYRIIQISDIHMGGWMTRARLHNIVTHINALRPDLIAITGDFIDRSAGEVIDDLAGPLKRLQANDGVVAVLGNHDYYFGANGVRQVLSACCITDLSNRVHPVRRGDSALYIAGVDDVVERRDRLDAVLDQLPNDGAAILLAHEPDFADISGATERFGLQLSGHTHGGQVRLPLIGSPILPSHGKRYSDGLLRAGEMQVYVNRGVGMIAPYVRLGARPEVTLLTLLSS
jgi:predicted MPP superfamily phosphohydrolase